MINVVIPSYKRADKMVGKDYFYMAKYVIPASQLDEYLEHIGGDRLIVIPDDQDGSIGKKRNWILKNVPRPLLMIDDDVKHIEYWDHRHDNYLRMKLEREYVMEFIEAGFDLCDQFGCKMWGVAQNPDDRVYLDYKPFSLTNIVLGPFQGHLEHNLEIDERMGTKEDYDMSLQQLNRYSKIFRWNKFCYQGEQQTNQGGICSYRSIDKEIEWCKAIMKKWGRSIIKYNIPPLKMTDLKNGNVHVPIKGV